MTDRLLTIAQAAERLGLSAATLRKWRAERRALTFVKMGDALRVEEAELRRFIRKHRERRSVA